MRREQGYYNKHPQAEKGRRRGMAEVRAYAPETHAPCKPSCLLNNQTEEQSIDIVLIDEGCFVGLVLSVE